MRNPRSSYMGCRWFRLEGDWCCRTTHRPTSPLDFHKIHWSQSTESLCSANAIRRDCVNSRQARESRPMDHLAASPSPTNPHRPWGSSGPSDIDPAGAEYRCRRTCLSRGSQALGTCTRPLGLGRRRAASLFPTFRRRPRRTASDMRRSWTSLVQTRMGGVTGERNAPWTPFKSA